MRSLGVHLRLTTTLTQLALCAKALNVPLWQCFFVYEKTGKYIDFNPDDIVQFVALRRQHFTQLYAHGSYAINLSALTPNGYRALKYELLLAQKYEFTHFVLHAGNAKNVEHRSEGIDALARQLNKLIATTHGIHIVLENTAHGGSTIGSDFNDFALLLSKLDDPEKISFCIDTAHAYAYGYDITTPAAQEQFIAHVDSMIGVHRVQLIHFNDTSQSRGSVIDRHEIPGHGILANSLYTFVQHPLLSHIPLIIEPPLLSSVQLEAMLKNVHATLMNLRY